MYGVDMHENKWVTSKVSFKYMLSDLVLLKRNLVLKVRPFQVISRNSPSASISSPDIDLSENEQGYLMRSNPMILAGTCTMLLTLVKYR